MIRSLGAFALHLSLLLISPALQAVELFGVDLNQAKAEEFFPLIEKAGIEPVPDAGDDRYRVYDSSSFFPGSRYLYLGFIPESGQFAFAEYQFSGRQQGYLLSKLNAKYGKPEIRKGRFSSDTSFSWVNKGIEIKLSFDWYSYNTRLSYINPQTLQNLKDSSTGFDSKDSASDSAVQLIYY